ncbi:MAG: DNA-3-methyladenine glycosylase I [Flavobacteriales bacterium]|nr:DNA-3-methyladenine glycosylase I [Flavobacteriales bacterium]
MDQPSSYCAYVHGLPEGNVHRIYHDTQYGFPIEDDDELFGRLVLEINQAGLSWTTILNKQDHFRLAYSGFSIDAVAAYDDVEVERLLADAGIIRNRLKILAAVHNARQIQELRKEHGSFKAWLDFHHPLDHAAWVKLFKKTFRFTGGEITKEFLMSTGYLPGAHVADCPVYHQLNT